MIAAVRGYFGADVLDELQPRLAGHIHIRQEK
jgi:hypothetical protein